jgi:hypothetical protein
MNPLVRALIFASACVWGALIIVTLIVAVILLSSK